MKNYELYTYEEYELVTRVKKRKIVGKNYISRPITNRYKIDFIYEPYSIQSSVTLRVNNIFKVEVSDIKKEIQRHYRINMDAGKIIILKVERV